MKFLMLLSQMIFYYFFFLTSCSSNYPDIPNRNSAPNQKSQASNQKPQAPNQKPQAPNQKPQALNQKPQAPNNKASNKTGNTRSFVLGSIAPAQEVVNKKTKQCGTFSVGDANIQTCSLPDDWVYEKCPAGWTNIGLVEGVKCRPGLWDSMFNKTGTKAKNSPKK